jgi:branched-chain amino acid transport system substrate-binding protein
VGAGRHVGPARRSRGAGFLGGNQDGIDLLNEQGGICGAMLEFSLRDTAYEAEQEIAAFQEAVEAGVPYVLTYASPASIALKELTIEHQIPNIAAGLSAEAFYIPRNGYTVGVAPIYSDQFAGFLQWASENWADIKPEGAGDDIVVGVVGWEGPFGAGATTPEALEYAESIGVTVLALETVPVDPAADVTPQLTSLLSQGANVIYNQSLSFTPARVILTLQGMGVWDSLVVGGVNWSMNTDVMNIVTSQGGDPAGYYGVFPWLWWNDTDNPGVQAAIEAFDAGGYPESDRAVSYLTSFAGVPGLAEVTFRTIQEFGYENLNGANWFATFQEMGTVSASGVYTFNVVGEDRAPREAQIRQVQTVDGQDFTRFRIERRYLPASAVRRSVLRRARHAVPLRKHIGSDVNL